MWKVIHLRRLLGFLPHRLASLIFPLVLMCVPFPTGWPFWEYLESVATRIAGPFKIFPLAPSSGMKYTDVKTFLKAVGSFTLTPVEAQRVLDWLLKVNSPFELSFYTCYRNFINILWFTPYLQGMTRLLMDRPVDESAARRLPSTILDHFDKNVCPDLHQRLMHALTFTITKVLLLVIIVLLGPRFIKSCMPAIIAAACRIGTFLFTSARQMVALLQKKGTHVEVQTETKQPDLTVTNVDEKASNVALTGTLNIQPQPENKLMSSTGSRPNSRIGTGEHSKADKATITANPSNTMVAHPSQQGGVSNNRQVEASPVRRNTSIQTTGASNTTATQLSEVSNSRQVPIRQSKVPSADASNTVVAQPSRQGGGSNNQQVKAFPVTPNAAVQTTGASNTTATQLSEVSNGRQVPIRQNKIPSVDASNTMVAHPSQQGGVSNNQQVKAFPAPQNAAAQTTGASNTTATQLGEVAKSRQLPIRQSKVPSADASNTVIAQPSRQGGVSNTQQVEAFPVSRNTAVKTTAAPSSNPVVAQPSQQGGVSGSQAPRIQQNAAHNESGTKSKPPVAPSTDPSLPGQHKSNLTPAHPGSGSQGGPASSQTENNEVVPKPTVSGTSAPELTLPDLEAYFRVSRILSDVFRVDPDNVAKVSNTEGTTASSSSANTLEEKRMGFLDIGMPPGLNVNINNINGSPNSPVVKQNSRIRGSLEATDGSQPNMTTENVAQPPPVSGTGNISTQNTSLPQGPLSQGQPEPTSVVDSKSRSRSEALSSRKQEKVPEKDILQTKKKNKKLQK